MGLTRSSTNIPVCFIVQFQSLQDPNQWPIGISKLLPKLPQRHIFICFLLHHLCDSHLKVLLSDMNPSLSQSKHPCFSANSLQWPIISEILQSKQHLKYEKNEKLKTSNGKCYSQLKYIWDFLKILPPYEMI